MEIPKDEITTTEVYVKDTTRLTLLKYEIDNPAIKNKPDVIRYLINEHYDKQLTKNQ